MNMKKLVFFVMMFLTLSVSMTMVSCGDDEPVGGQTDSGTGQDGEDVSGDSLSGNVGLDINSQKKFIANTANELMSAISARDFMSASSLIEYVERISHDNSVLGTWIDDCMKLCQVSATDDIVKNVYKLSNFYGQFELVNGRWIQTADNVSYLEFNFTDSIGSPCSLRLECSGKETAVHHEAFDDEEWRYYYDGDGSYTLYTRIENTYVIPERIDVTLNQGGYTVASLEMLSKLSLKGGDGEFDYKRDAAELTVKASVGGYTWAIDRVAFNAGRSASFSESLKKDGTTLVSLTASAEGDITDEANPSGGITILDFDIMGRVRIAGSISDIAAFSANLASAEENDRNENTFKEYLKKANDGFDLKLYLGGSGESCAYMQLYPFADYDYYGETWSYEPVIMFSDGTSYSTFESYFDEFTYSEVIQRFTELVDSFNAIGD